jgi:hypothetical protein
MQIFSCWLFVITEFAVEVLKAVVKTTRYLKFVLYINIFSSNFLSSLIAALRYPHHSKCPHLN